MTFAEGSAIVPRVGVAMLVLLVAYGGKDKPLSVYKSLISTRPIKHMIQLIRRRPAAMIYHGTANFPAHGKREV